MILFEIFDWSGFDPNNDTGNGKDIEELGCKLSIQEKNFIKRLRNSEN